MFCRDTRDNRANYLIRNWTDRIDDPYVIPNSEAPLWWAEDVAYHLSYQLSDRDVDRLNHVKYRLFEFEQFWWEEVLEALRVYKRAFGHVNVPPSFVVTEEMLELNIGFTMDHYAMKLGAFCQQLRSGDADGFDDPVRRPILDAMGFEWGDMRHHLRFRFLPMMCLLTMRFSLNLFEEIEADYVVPDDKLWPDWAVHLPLGEWVQLVRMQRKVLQTFYPDRLKALDIFFRPDRIMDAAWGADYDYQWEIPTPDWLREKYERRNPVPQIGENEAVDEEVVKKLTEGVIKIGREYPNGWKTRQNSEVYQQS